MEVIIDCLGNEVKIGDKVKGEGFIKFQDNFKIDRTPIVTVREEKGIIYFGGLSKQSFGRFWKVN